MPDPPSSRDEALKRFDERYEALAAGQKQSGPRFDAERGADLGYRVLGELFGGILGGLGLGWVFDRMVGTTPWGMIAGVLAGLVLSVALVVRSAGRINMTPKPAPDGASVLGSGDLDNVARPPPGDN